MTDLSTTNLKRLLAEATPGPWKHDDEVGEILGAYYEKNGMGYIPNVGYADDSNADLIALAPELAADWLRMREALEKQLNGINLVIALADMIQPQTEAQQTAITLGRDLCDDLTRILEGDSQND